MINIYNDYLNVSASLSLLEVPRVLEALKIVLLESNVDKSFDRGSELMESYSQA